jgi:hypothetical protein
VPSSRARGEVGAVWLLVACASLLHACDHALAEEPAPICDGTSSIRLLAQTVTSEGRLLPGYPLLYENGAIYLLVDGRCHYWSFAAGAWSGVREGILSESAARSLSEALDYSEWPRSKGVWYPTLVPSDASALVLRGSPLDGGAVVCVGCGAAGSSVPGLSDAMVRAFSNMQPEAERLWDAGADVTGPVRYILASDPGNHLLDPHLEWPAQVGDAASLAISYADAFTLQFFDPRIRRVEGAQAEALRALRRKRFTDPLYRNFEWIPVRDAADAGYWLFVRDVIPYESTDGRL